MEPKCGACHAFGSGIRTWQLNKMENEWRKFLSMWGSDHQRRRGRRVSPILGFAGTWITRLHEAIKRFWEQVRNRRHGWCARRRGHDAVASINWLLLMEFSRSSTDNEPKHCRCWKQKQSSRKRLCVLTAWQQFPPFARVKTALTKTLQMIPHARCERKQTSCKG